MAAVAPTDRPKSVRNRCIIEVFVGVFVISRCFWDFSVAVGAFVIWLSQISSFFSSYRMETCLNTEVDLRLYVRASQILIRHVFVKHGCPGCSKVKIWLNFLSSTFCLHSYRRGMWCQWSVGNPLVNLQSKSGYGKTTQTLNIALCL